jgi:hypothetical protein
LKNLKLIHSGSVQRAAYGRYGQTRRRVNVTLIAIVKWPNSVKAKNCCSGLSSKTAKRRGGCEMAVFYDTGGGDIYAGKNKKACIDAMLKDSPDTDLSEVIKVSGKTLMSREPGPIEDEYADSGYGYCIASENV